VSALAALTVKYWFFVQETNVAVIELYKILNNEFGNCMQS